VLRGIVTILLLTLNLIFWGSLVVPVAAVRFLLPQRATRKRIKLAAAALAERWVAGNDRIFDLMLPTQWDIRGVDVDDPNGKYLILANHLSWVDIFALFRAFHGRAAFIRFFLKRQLLYSPIVGQACWALDFPFMRRYTPEYLDKHPEKRGADLATTRRACRRYVHIPVAILNFCEGTRFSREKHADQESPYRHLLRPRVGGVAFVLASLGDQLDAVLDVTLAYPGHDITMWQFVSGRVPRIAIRAWRLDVPSEFLTAEITEPGPARERFKQWIDGMWREKDALLDALLTSDGILQEVRPHQPAHSPSL
jgi:1-acyl-sn-glycerol-3-phosphate acyltransferase